MYFKLQSTVLNNWHDYNILTLLLDFALPDDNWDLESNSSGLSSYSEEEEGNELLDKEMNKYMQKMDQELLSTDVAPPSVENPPPKVIFQNSPRGTFLLI